jgi:hypothetical protein
MKEFPELAAEDHEKLRKLDEDWMKTPDGKKRWRKFIEQWVTSRAYSLYQVNINSFQIRGQGYRPQFWLPYTYECGRRVLRV